MKTEQPSDANNALENLTPREQAGRFLLHKRHHMGEQIDAGKVQDYLEEMFSRIAELREQQRWTPVSERLPEDGSPVLLVANGAVEVGFRGTPDCWFLERTDAIDDAITFLDGSVTHWRPLPAPPEGL